MVLAISDGEKLKMGVLSEKDKQMKGTHTAREALKRTKQKPQNKLRTYSMDRLASGRALRIDTNIRRGCWSY